METTKVNSSVTLNDASKLSLLLELLQHLDLLRVDEVTPAISAVPAPNVSSFHSLSGIWADRDVDAAELRRKAWGCRGA